MIESGRMDQVQRMIKQLGNEVKNIIRGAIELSYYSRGAWSYHEVLTMSAGEREVASEFISERLKVAAKMANPVF